MLYVPTATNVPPHITRIILFFNCLPGPFSSVLIAVPEMACYDYIPRTWHRVGTQLIFANEILANSENLGESVYSQ